MGAYPNSTDDPQNCLTAWFAVLERARLDGDLRLAQKAEGELRRLGVIVRFVEVPMSVRSTGARGRSGGKL